MLMSGILRPKMAYCKKRLCSLRVLKCVLNEWAIGSRIPIACPVPHVMPFGVCRIYSDP